MKKRTFFLILCVVAIIGAIALGCGDPNSGNSGGNDGGGNTGNGETPVQRVLTLDSNIDSITEFTGSGNYYADSNVTLNVTYDNNDYYFLGWYDGEELLSTDVEYLFKMRDKDLTVNALFMTNTGKYNWAGSECSIALKPNVSSYGNVKINDGEYSSSINQKVTKGGDVKISAKTLTDKSFLGWFDEKDNFISSNTTFSFKMPEFGFSLVAKWKCEHNWVKDKCSVCNETAKGLTYKKLDDGYEVSGFGTLESTDLVIPSSYEGLPVISIAKSALSNSSITSVSLPIGLKSIGTSAFANCESLTNVSLPNSINSIGAGSFSNCVKLTSIVIPDGVTSIETQTFIGCTSLTSVYLPDSVTSIGSMAFNNCISLESVNIPSGVSSIKSGAFYGCGKLKTFTIPDNVTSIQAGSFNGCTSLEYIVIGKNVNNIGNYAFYGCSSLNKIYFKGTEDEWNNVTKGDDYISFASVPRYYYSENQPSSSGNFWHYDTDGITPKTW